MITNSFMHIPGVGHKKESEIWLRGILDWQQFLHTRQQDGFYKKIERNIQDSINALENRNHRYFSDSLPTTEHWRIFREFADSTAYIDIETTGLTPDYDEITTIALYNGTDIKTWVRGKGLKGFIKEIAKYNLLVTFNGKCFDIPFIQKSFGVELRQSHIDLRYVLSSLGFLGGLKACERAFGISRDELTDVDGLMAVYLWEEYQRGKKSALDTLLAYNIEDVINLEYLMHCAYNKKIANLNFANLALPIPQRPEIPFEVDTRLISKLKKTYFPWR